LLLLVLMLMLRGLQRLLLLLWLLLLLHLCACKTLVHNRHHPHGHHHFRADARLRRRERSGDRLCLRELHLQLMVLHLCLLPHVHGQCAAAPQRERDLLDLRLQLRDVVNDHLRHRQVRRYVLLRIQAGLKIFDGGSLCARM
jgi:hypothetical protein